MKKYLSGVLTAILIVSMFSGCGKSVDQNGNVVNGEFTEYLVAEKIGTVGRDNFTTADGGIYYKGDNGLWGIISLNGALDTGAIYTDILAKGVYFQVWNREISGINDFSGLNATKLVDGKGNTIVSGYACYDVINTRYIKVTEITEFSYTEDETVASCTDKLLCQSGINKDGTWYKGRWRVYDIMTEQYVPGASGSYPTIVSAKGRWIQFNDADGNYVKVNENGESLPDGVTLFDDGSYAVEGRAGEVYSETGELLFNYDLTGYIPSSFSNGYYMAKKYEDGATKYVVMDTKGEILSTEFDESLTIYGELLHANDQVYDLKGNVVIKGTYTSVYYDKMFENNWMLKNGDYYTIINKEGDVFFNGAYKGNDTVWTDDFLASKKIDDKSYYYSYKDNDYTIEGYHFAPWIVKTSSNNSRYDLVDTMTGKKLLEGYSDYSSISRNSMAYYVYAKYENGADVYLIVSGSQLEDVLNRKNNLFDDLATAFANEGINVTVDKESGEMALDSSVLFGGDSAELTAEGKAFLNKFIKAYTTVAFSEKYEGFISKTIVEGHTAPVEGSTYASGLQLSEERAQNVKNYCLSSETGADISKISVTLEDVGYSNSKPVYDANGNVDLAASRRVSFRFMVNVEF